MFGIFEEVVELDEAEEDDDDDDDATEERALEISMQ